jgi:hypothetical protein
MNDFIPTIDSDHSKNDDELNIQSNQPICSSELLQYILDRIDKHHGLYPDMPIKDLYWEYILYKSFCDTKVKCTWNRGSNAVGTDISIEESPIKNKRVSCKSGKISFSKKENRITRLMISGFRTYSKIGLDEKLNYIDQDHEDFIFSLSSSLIKSQNKYILSIFNPPKFKNMKWEVCGKNYKASSEFIDAQIKSHSGDQLWYSIKYNSPLILEKHELYLNKKSNDIDTIVT